MDVAWSADPDAADVDEPSSRSSPAAVEFESAHDGALVGGESDCFSFNIETHEALRVLITWDVVPLELQQQSAQPELRLSNGLLAPTPEVEVVADDDTTLTRYRWRALQEGEATLCLEGQNDRFQPYVWAGLLSFEGMGPVDPSGFTGEGLYPAGGGQVDGVGPEESLSEPPSGLRALPGVMLLCVGLLEFTRRTTSGACVLVSVCQGSCSSSSVACSTHSSPPQPPSSRTGSWTLTVSSMSAWPSCGTSRTLGFPSRPS